MALATSLARFGNRDHLQEVAVVRLKCLLRLMAVPSSMAHSAPNTCVTRAVPQELYGARAAHPHAAHCVGAHRAARC